METEAVLELLTRVSAEVVEPRFRALSDDEVHEKRPGDPVTVADREAEVLLTRALRSAWPDAVVLGEEAYAGDPSLMQQYATAEHAFTVDPVDGTNNFIRGSADHAMMLAEVLRGEVVRSWTWHPQHRVSYVAERGAGAWRNGERLERAPATTQPVGRTSNRAWAKLPWGELSPLQRTWFSCGVDYPRLVEGEADFLLYRGQTSTSHRGMPWDHAPGSLLVTETGGVVCAFDGEPYHPQRLPTRGLLVAADPATADLVLGQLGDL
ncbi:inositol monophosphatase [Nocardioides seonyuensis]|uniref:Inositol monophosphatase n=1 Tax=Nocardioides seonyuensis TaxID=2518371 RepID=A0A4P7IIM6_9ACTN|nr:inositol monophosphatase family protein [Nocardioides seonyuensis]QBX57236.1 inositol monophosphatase [Nocardioides seonyuensis]